jgi:hypothetical protein
MRSYNLPSHVVFVIVLGRTWNPVQRFGVVVEEAILKSEGITGNDFGNSDILRFCVES